MLAGSASIESLTAVVDLFFESVMVNDENLAVRQNRYVLLSILHAHYCQQWGRLSLLQG